jgi:hypothetical protein
MYVADDKGGSAILTKANGKAFFESRRSFVSFLLYRECGGLKKAEHKIQKFLFDTLTVLTANS